MKKERLNKNFLDEFQDYDFSKIKETKIFLVGSIQFKDYFIKIESILQIIYKKVVGICSVDGLLNKDKFNEEEWDKLQEIAIRKLNDQETILVIDVDNYIGEQSREEIEYFNSHLHKPVYYLSRLKKI
ncbi:MAG: hypothetical protein KGD74_05675 [Candidatus Lokiarchaeota archaeon]|nr:hypothetical protein [Candidatus Lokiarchaeota archaeon]